MRAYRTVRRAAVVISVLLWTYPAAILLAQPAITAPAGVQVIDTPNDGGESLTLVWAPSPSDGPEEQYEVLIGDPGAADPSAFKVVAKFPANTRYVKQAKAAWWTRAADPAWHQYVIRSGKGVELKDGTAYPVTVAMRRGDERIVAPVLQATPHPDWFNWNQINNLILALGFGALVFYAISHVVLLTAAETTVFCPPTPRALRVFPGFVLSSSNHSNRWLSARGFSLLLFLFMGRRCPTYSIFETSRPEWLPENPSNRLA